MNKNINTLKLILALMVIYCHAEIFPEIGHFAVCMFFMLSGYLIKSKIERQNRRYCFSDVKKQFFPYSTSILPNVSGVCIFTVRYMETDRLLFLDSSRMSDPVLV